MRYALRVAHDVAVGAAMVSYENSIPPFSPHVPLRLTVRALHGVLVEDLLTKTQQPLVERSTSNTSPCTQPVGALLPRVEDEARVLE